MGYEGLIELVKFVQQGGTLITEGSTSTILPEYKITTGINVENPARLFVRGSILRGIFTDKSSPLLYGYQGNEVPVYFNQDPVLAVGAGAGGFGGRGGFGGGNDIPGVGMNITPMASASQQRLATYDPDEGTQPVNLSERPSPGDVAAVRQGLGGGRGRGGGRGAGGQGTGRGAAAPSAGAPRVIMEFPSNPNEMLLSGTLVGGEALANRAELVDIPLGEGHVVSFAIRPFWRWQTQGTYFLAFNAILNWNDLDAGRGAGVAATEGGGR
jgi:hypothetical protein